MDHIDTMGRMAAVRQLQQIQHKADMANVVDFLVARGQLGYTQEGPLESIDNLDPAYAARMLGEPDRFVAAVAEWVKEKEGTP